MDDFNEKFDKMTKLVIWAWVAAAGVSLIFLGLTSWGFIKLISWVVTK